MALRTEQYNTLMREYSLRQIRHRHELEERTAAIEKKVPRLSEIRRETAVNAAARARAKILGREEALQQLDEQHAALQEELAALMASGRIDMRKMISGRFNLEDIEEGFKIMSGKVLVSTEYPRLQK